MLGEVYLAVQRIDDHGFWAGGKKAGVPLPMETKMKEEKSAEGAGAVGKYEDTTEAIKGVQMAGEKKIKGHKMKDGYRY